jgi:nicotinate-nucleotide--dimethylbenzimidazole phosphoribosyltransferase
MDVNALTSDILSPHNEKLQRGIQERLDDLTKPPGSLGRLEEIAIQYCLCRGNRDATIERRKMFTFAADHGVVQEKVTPYPQAVTLQMVQNMVAGGAAISVLCKNEGIESTVVDIGTAGDLEAENNLVIRKVSRGTASFLRGPAMSREQCDQALSYGYEFARDDGADLYGIGEMGIGNTSSASALFSLLLDIPAQQTTGAGTGASGKLLAHKIETVKQSVDMHRREWNNDPYEALRRLGGLEIAAMTGFILGAASVRVPVVVDGFISSAAALVAIKLHPAVREYLFFSHASSEKFHREFLHRLEIVPLLDLGMRLGEGTGAALAIGIITQALNCYHQMASFSEAGVSNKE